jgi:hypothetical protein
MLSEHESEGKNKVLELKYMHTVIRKLACRLLIEMAHGNERAQSMMCEAFSFTPIKGQVALNNIPKNIQTQIIKDPMILTQIKNV